MAGYVIAQIDVTDPDLFAKYREKVPATIEQYGGRYAVRGGELTSLEETPPKPRVVVIEFDSVEAAQKWYHSEEYAPLIKMRNQAANGPLFIVEGA